MQAHPISVTLAIGAAPNRKTLAATLLSAGMLRQLIDLGPFLEVYESSGNGDLRLVSRSPAYALSKRVVWGLWHRLPRTIRPTHPMRVSVWVADRLLSKRLVPTKIFHGCTGVCLACLRTAKKQGAITLIENASCHPRHWRRVELEESHRFGAVAADGIGNNQRMFRRMDTEFAECDRIVVPSVVARQSFVKYGFREDKVVVVPTGVDANFFTPPAQPIPQSVFRVCYVGRIEHAKGVGYLLQAWKRLALPNAELVLVGQVKPQLKSLLEGYADCRIKVAGILPPLQVAACYHESSLLVMPSPNEGLAYVILEAMASGLPVVATDKTGASDCMTNGREGLIVPASSADALAEAIHWCYQHREEIPAMGKAGRARIESEFTLEHHNRRVIQLYQRLVTERSGAELTGTPQIHP
jgi:glycosyltransferase involved in cell wall biosynthesis